MADFADTVLEGELVETPAAPVLAALPSGPAGAANLYAVGELIAGRAPHPSTRSQYARI